MRKELLELICNYADKIGEDVDYIIKNMSYFDCNDLLSLKEYQHSVVELLNAYKEVPELVKHGKLTFVYDNIFKNCDLIDQRLTDRMDNKCSLLLSDRGATMLAMLLCTTAPLDYLVNSTIIKIGGYMDTDNNIREEYINDSLNDDLLFNIFDDLDTLSYTYSHMHELIIYLKSSNENKITRDIPELIDKKESEYLKIMEALVYIIEFMLDGNNFKDSVIVSNLEVSTHFHNMIARLFTDTIALVSKECVFDEMAKVQLSQRIVTKDPFIEMCNEVIDKIILNNIEDLLRSRLINTAYYAYLDGKPCPSFSNNVEILQSTISTMENIVSYLYDKLYQLSPDGVKIDIDTHNKNYCEPRISVENFECKYNVIDLERSFDIIKKAHERNRRVFDEKMAEDGV